MRLIEISEENFAGLRAFHSAYTPEIRETAPNEEELASECYTIARGENDGE